MNLPGSGRYRHYTFATFVGPGIALMLTGCASFSPDAGMGPVATRISATIGGEARKISSEQTARSAQARVDQLLTRPLSASSAVQIALLNNRGLQAEYNELGLSEVAYVEASLPPNPVFSLERIASANALDIERRIIGNLLALLTLPSRKEIARREFEAAKYRAIGATFRLATETRKAFYEAVAARQLVSLLERARTSADAAAELTIKLGETGAATTLAQARASAFYAELSTQLAQARLQATVKREELIRLLGLWGGDSNFKLPSSLPKLPARLRTPLQVEADAIRNRVDLVEGRIRLAALAKSLGLTQATRFVSMAELAGIFAHEHETTEEGDKEKASPKGFELALEIPIFDLGETKTRRAAETYMQAVNRLAERAVNARSEVRSAYATYRASFEIARQYRNKILPLRKTIDDQSILEYNGMLIDVIELLTTLRESIESNVAAVEAARDFFVAQSQFEAVLIGGSESGGAEEAPTIAVSAESSE
ncbi:TolC family protein [Rhodoligotrophos ferricapiens]|uniref:TolC family protein n=1 Tax=Rhodoligotrophos ferricapiens TaxID=3069264 RepID=UPI00315C55E0